MSTYTKVYPVPSEIPVHVLMCDSAEYKNYNERTGSMFDLDLFAYNGGELGGHLPDIAEKMSNIHFIYADSRSAVVIYYNDKDKRWKLITHDHKAGANKYDINVVTHECVPNDDQTRMHKMPNVNFASQVFNLESGRWEDLPMAQGAGQEQKSAETFRICFKI